MQQSSISYSWRKRDAAKGFTSGVSLHSHTSMSCETLSHLAVLGTNYKVLRPIFANRERYCREAHGYELNYRASYWCPPLSPRKAFDVERRQIEDHLALPALVSLSDHDDIRAPLQLRSGCSPVQIPISVEWTMPYDGSEFHIGIHNLPADAAHHWMRILADFTSEPSIPRINEILAELHAQPRILIIFNHPIWDLNKVGADLHLARVDEFLTASNHFIHAFELNGLRSWQENRQSQLLAQKWNQLLIGGGDRHGVEPNAIANLTHASTFDDFVDEVRRDRISHIHFMSSYDLPLKYRVFESTLDVIRYYPDFPEGTRAWDDRVFHPDHQGVPRPISQLWPGDGRPPAFVRSVLGGVRLLGRKPISSSLRLAWNDRRGLRTALSP